jgi:hypothetical protein
VAEPGEGFGEESGDVHLGDAAALGDFVLGEVAVEAEDEDLSFAFGEVLEQGLDGEVVVDGGEVGVVLADEVAAFGGVVVGAGGGDGGVEG